jgi:hypothetical protein
MAEKKGKEGFFDGILRVFGKKGDNANQTDESTTPVCVFRCFLTFPDESGLDAEQSENPYTEITLLEHQHKEIIRFMVVLDDSRYFRSLEV